MFYATFMSCFDVDTIDVVLWHSTPNRPLSTPTHTGTQKSKLYLRIESTAYIRKLFCMYPVYRRCLTVVLLLIDTLDNEAALKQWRVQQRRLCIL